MVFVVVVNHFQELLYLSHYYLLHWKVEDVLLNIFVVVVVVVNIVGVVGIVLYLNY